MGIFDYQEYLSNLSNEERKHAPESLYIEGDHSLLTEGLKIAVVGSRKASELGLKRAAAFAKVLVKNDIIVVSGLAAGIDTAAHEAAIKYGGRTIAVLGTPLDKAYPKQNKDLLETIKRDHLAISQFPTGYPAQRKNFPMRNKTMALVTDATVIVEAGEKSGTKHQGWEALRLGRSLFIMQNVAEDKNLTWPKQMIEYGAQVLSRDGLSETLQEIPNYTTQVPVFAF